MPIKGTSPCGAGTRQGTPCQNPAMTNGRCRMHGGKTPCGIASPNLTTGRRSKYLLGGLADKVDEAERDPELMNLRSEIILIDALMAERCERLDSGESDEVWNDLIRLRGALEKDLASENLQRLHSYAAQFTGLIDRGIVVRSATRDVMSLIEQRRKLVESEARRLGKIQQMVSYEDLALFMRRVFTSIREHVADQHALERIAQDLAPVLKDKRT
jgi:hypothetical protein